MPRGNADTGGARIFPGRPSIRAFGSPALARNWSDSEVDAIVRDYFAMLEDEQRGRKFNKAQHRRSLMERIPRSHGSIERKHQNISAVLNAFGLPYIDGYKPLGNYQRLLFEAVESHLDSHSSLHGLLAGEDLSTDQGRPVPTGTEQFALKIEPPPAPPSEPLPGRGMPDEILRIVRRFERPDERDARNRRLGSAGEQFVFESERNRLLELDRDDLAAGVRWVARDDGDGFGYDIKSFAGAGSEPETERWLEVKTTTGSITTPFFITRNELRVSDRHRDVFRVVRLYSFRPRSAMQPARAYRLKPPLNERVRLEPAVYRASF